MTDSSRQARRPLDAIPRSAGRQRLRQDGGWPDSIHGIDHWHAWEISWLAPNGQPRAAVGEFLFPMEAPNLVESKSLKLYLNSLNNERFASAAALRDAIRQDLQEASGGKVETLIHELAGPGYPPAALLPEPPQQGADYLDSIDLGAENLDLTAAGPSPELLKAEEGGQPVAATLRSDLFRSACPVTGQPDWASVEIRCRGPRLDKPALLRYLLSYRHHRAFHEECAERIFRDLHRACQPDSLHLALHFLRRGGLDISIYRSAAPLDTPAPRRRLLRQ